jgi:predicted O-linked N-acetylglucosamine transferase (SPINDLY family)
MTQQSEDEFFESAVKLHEAGKFADAEPLYRQILSSRPDDAEVLQLLALNIFQIGKKEESLQLLDRAIAIDPGNADIHFSLGTLLAQMSRHEQAVGPLSKAAELKADFAEANQYLGISFLTLKRFEEALEAFHRALAARPNSYEACNNVGTALRAMGRFDEAITMYRRAASLRPDRPDSHKNLGSILASKGDWSGAADAWGRAAALQPGDAQIALALGKALLMAQKLEEAIAALARAAALRPDWIEAWLNLATAQVTARRYEQAAVACREALKLQPRRAQVWANLGYALNAAWKLDEAIEACREALRIDPNLPGAYVNLGNAVQSTGLIEQAVENYNRAIQLDPDCAEAQDGKLVALFFHPDFDGPAIKREHIRWNQQIAAPFAKEIAPHANDRSPDRRLRIGYLSPDFRRHAESFFTVPFLSAHDHSAHEIFCYADSNADDEVTGWIRGCADVWRNTAGWSHKQIAKIVRDDQIDILVDLTMHMDGSRLMVFARKPAPVQVTWLAYPGTTGLATMDYRITDRWMDPIPSTSSGEAADRDVDYVEQSVRLPDCWVCYDPLSQASPPPPRREGPIRFLSLNHPRKSNSRTVDNWARVLAAVDGSRMLLMASADSYRQRALEQFRRHGVSSDRIDFVDRLPREAYLHAHYGIDIALDSIPYNGITTTLDALWMGVPVVTLTGRTAASRAGYGILGTLGLEELIAHSVEEFISIAKNLAGDLPRVAELRSTLRARLQASPIMDRNKFARNMEAAYRRVWKNWCVAAK